MLYGKIHIISQTSFTTHIFQMVMMLISLLDGIIFEPHIASPHYYDCNFHYMPLITHCQVTSQRYFKFVLRWC